MSLVVVTALPLREGEDADELATRIADAVAAATGGREGDGMQAWGQTDLEAHIAAKRACRSVCSPPK